jgi:effector-binding domain-containing protein
MQEIAIVDVPSRQVVGITKTGRYLLIPELLMKVYESIEENKLTITGMPMFICHETSPEAVREANEKGTAVVEVAWPVSGTLNETDEIRMYELPGGKMVRAVHHGPYETCESTYLKVFSWIAEHRLRIAGPIREIYPNDPRVVKPEEIITEIMIPVS